MNLAERAAATQITKDAFWGVPHSWARITCVHLLHDHLVIFGHDVPVVPNFRTKKGAREALKAMGATSLPSLLKGLGLEEIPPAKMLVGDVAIVPGEGNRTDGIRGAIAISAGNGKFMGWHEAAEGFTIIDDILPHAKAAFRV